LTAHRSPNDLSFVLRVVDLLEQARLRTWLFGGWAEELLGVVPPGEHSDIDLLYPGRDFERVDVFLRHSTVEEAGRPESHERAFALEGVRVELLLVQLSERGWFSDLPGGRFDWPADVFTTGGRLPVASEAALAGYRAAHTSLSSRRAA
jgi:hypothetical protein